MLIIVISVENAIMVIIVIYGRSDKIYVVALFNSKTFYKFYHQKYRIYNLRSPSNLTLAPANLM